MIIGLWHPGSGLGDQLFCYLAARITAGRVGVPFTMVGQFKGDSFMKLDKGVTQMKVDYHIEMPAGKIVVKDWCVYEGKTYYDPEFNFIPDNTVVDGCRIQDERYFQEALAYPNHWLEVEPIKMPDDLCIIGFRGGEYSAIPDLFLPKSYWEQAVALKRAYIPNIRFQVHTDDPILAQKFFPEFECIHDIGINWRSVRYAKHLIIANSAFYILPALLNENVKEVIAPRYWARRNIKEWSTPQNYYKKFTHI